MIQPWTGFLDNSQRKGWINGSTLESLGTESLGQSSWLLPAALPWDEKLYSRHAWFTNYLEVCHFSIRRRGLTLWNTRSSKMASITWSEKVKQRPTRAAILNPYNISNNRIKSLSIVACICARWIDACKCWVPRNRFRILIEKSVSDALRKLIAIVGISMYFGFEVNKKQRKVEEKSNGAW